MKELKDMTAAELVAERKQIEKQWGIVPDVRRIEIGSESLQPQYDAIAAELDARCEKWRMEVVDRSFVAVDFDHLGRLFRKGKFYFKIPAAELHALLGYLIYMIPKGGAK